MTLVRAALAGAGGALVLAVSDFLAVWLWLPHAFDRALLALRLIGLLPPIGALLAVSLVEIDRAARPMLIRASGRRAARLRRLAPLPTIVLALPALVALAVAVFSGPRVAAFAPLGIVFAVVVSVLLLYTMLFALRRWLRPPSTSLRTGGRRWRAVVAIAVAIGLAKLDQDLYPRHYDALHAALSVIAWISASFGVRAILPRRVGLGVRPRRAVTTLVVVLAATLLGLPIDHDGRAALLSPRTPSSRSVMLAISPLLFAWNRSTASAEAIDRARRASRERRAALQRGRLPRWDGAHVVLITIDALRADHLGLYGYPRPISPNLDRLASRAVVFERAWTTTPRSSYSLCSMMTGIALEPREGELPSATMATVLSARGYHTAAFYPEGIFFYEGEHVARYRNGGLGFARRDSEDHDAESLTDAILLEIADVARRGEPPTFFWAHYFDVHEPYTETALGTAAVDRYDGEIRNVDRAIARLLDEGLGQLRREAVLLISADHGEEHGDHGGHFHGGSLYEEQLRVPLLVVAPGLAPRRVSAPVSLTDVAPTLWAMAGARPPAGVEGMDLRALMLGRADDRGPVRASEDQLHALVSWPHKLLIDEHVGTIELFDLARDPAERENIADARPELVEALSAELDAFDP